MQWIAGYDTAVSVRVPCFPLDDLNLRLFLVLSTIIFFQGGGGFAPELAILILMKSTTETQLSEQSFRDYLRETKITDQKLGLAFAYNMYADLFGIPLRLRANSPDKFAKVCLYVLRTVQQRVIYRAPKRPELWTSTRWLQKEISGAWKV